MSTDVRKASDLRREKLMAKGRSRLEKITGTLNVDEETIPAAEQGPVLEGDSRDSTPLPSEGLSTARAALPAAAVPVPNKIKAANPELSVQPRRKTGTAADHKWSEYHTAPSRRLPTHQKAIAQTGAASLVSAVESSATLRRCLAVFLALLLAFSWDASGMSTPSSWSRRTQVKSLQRAWHNVKSSGWKRGWLHLSESVRSSALMEGTVLLSKPQFASPIAFLQGSRPILVVVCIDIAVICIFFVAAKIAPTFFHSADEAQGPPPASLLWRLLSAMPQLRARIEQLAAWQQLVASLIDDAAAFIVSMVLYQLVPML